MLNDWVFFFLSLFPVAGQETSLHTATQRIQCRAPTSSPFSCNGGKLPFPKSLEVEAGPKISTLLSSEEMTKIVSFN